MKLKFEEVSSEELNNGWTMGAGVVVGVAGTIALAAALT